MPSLNVCVYTTAGCIKFLADMGSWGDELTALNLIWQERTPPTTILYSLMMLAQSCYPATAHNWAPRPETQQNLWTKFYNTRICSLSGCSTSASSHGNKTCKPLKQQQQQQNEIKTLV
uniref:Uncharacterized protein n=1 Tax=Oryza nivara TaxID=4536 RepID=A0A0E0J702_ORYNI